MNQRSFLFDLRIFFGVGAAACALKVPASLGQAQVFPTHLTLTEAAPTSHLNLRNSSSNTQAYRIDLVHFRMDAQGNMRRLNEQKTFLQENLKYSPKTVEVAPGAKQVVRLMLPSFEGLTDGEHSVYLHVVPMNSQSEAQSKSTQKKVGAAMSLQAKIAVAIPVVVRVGEPKFGGEISDFSAALTSDSALKVRLKLKNSTRYFLTGDLEITGITPAGEISLQKILGVSSYVPERYYESTITKGAAVLPVQSPNSKAAEQRADDNQSADVEPESGPTLGQTLGSASLAEIRSVRVRYVANSESGVPFELTALTPVTFKAASIKASKGSGQRQTGKNTQPTSVSPGKSRST